MDAVIPIIYSLGFAQGLIISVILFSKAKTLDFKLLSLLLLVLAMGCLFDDNVLSSQGTLATLIWNGNQWLYGPLLLLFVNYWSTAQHRVLRGDWFHFLPFLLFKIAVLVDHFIGLPFNASVEQTIGYALVLQGLTYSILSIRKVSKIPKDNDKRNFILFLALSFLFAWIISFIGKTSPDFENIYAVVYLLGVFVIYSISYKLFSTPQFFSLLKEDETLQSGILKIKDRSKVFLIKHEEIIWLEADDNYVKVHTTKDRFLVRSTMAAMEEKLNSHSFQRIHRSYIINLPHVAQADFSQPAIQLSSGNTLNIGKKYLDDIRQQFKKN